MSVLRPRVRDDRGRRVARRRFVEDHSYDLVIGCFYGVLITGTLLFGAVPLTALLGWLLREALGLGRSPLIDGAVAVLTVAGLVLVALVPGSLLEHLLRRRLRRHVLWEERRCACCAYDLNGLAMEADGCTVCPECGAAWQMGEPIDGGSGPVSRG